MGLGLVYKEGTEPRQSDHKLTGSRESDHKESDHDQTAQVTRTLTEISREGTPTSIFQEAMSEC